MHKHELFLVNSMLVWAMIPDASSLGCVHVAILLLLSSLGSGVLSPSRMVPQVYIQPVSTFLLFYVAHESALT